MKYILICFFIASCAQVDQIDRGVLTSKIMQSDPAPEESIFINEVDAYREGSVGGTSAVGGGCGCN